MSENVQCESENCEINNMQIVMILIDNLIKSAAILTDLKDDINKNVLLDIAEKYLSEAKNNYVEKLDEDVLSIIDEVRSSLQTGE